MSAIHLSTGSTEPARVPGKLRIYSNKYCPFAQRVRLVAKAKNLDHDIVNIHLNEKPEWFLKISPAGKVPVLLDGDKVIVESLDIAEYLDGKSPENPLFPAEPARRQAVKQLAEKTAEILGTLREFFIDKNKTAKDLEPEIPKIVGPFEEELVKRGTTFIGGDKPGIADYLLWPVIERFIAVNSKLGIRLPSEEEDKLKVPKWIKTMQALPAVKETANTPENYWTLAEQAQKGGSINYDS